MKYVCMDCGKMFDDDEFVIVSENMGECFGVPAYEHYEATPCCKSTDFEEAEKCAICGEDFCDDDLINGVCENCLYDVDLDLCYKCGEIEPEEVKINSFLASIFNVSEIEQILYREIKNSNFSSIDLAKFIDNDKDNFAELLKEVKENENKKC